MLIGLANELDQEAADSVDEDEGADELARLVARPSLPEHEAEDQEQEQPLERSLVELARMARHRAGIREDDSPGQAGRRAPKLAVHEIGEATEEQAGRDGAGDVIVETQPIELVAPRQIEDAEADSDHSAVERHAAIPQADDLHRVLEIVVRLVEQDVAEPAPQDHSQGGIEHQIVGVATGHRGAGRAQHPKQIPPADDDARQICEAVPADRQRADVEGDRVKAEIAVADRVGRRGQQAGKGVDQGFPHCARVFIVGGEKKAKRGETARHA